MDSLSAAQSKTLSRAAAFLALAVLLLAPVSSQGSGTASDGAPDSGGGLTQLSYDVYAGGLKAMRADLTVDLAEEDYRLQLDAYFQGFIAKFFSLDMTVVAEGVLGDGGLQPRDYDMHSIWQKDKERRIQISFEGGRVREMSFVPEDRRPKRDAVKPRERNGALDPITALLWPIETLLQEEGCVGSTKVFDGRKLFALRLEDGGSKPLRASDYSVFGGEAQVCRLFIEQTAGPKKEKSKGRIPEVIEVYLAPLQEGGPPLPVRLEANNRLGKIVLHLSAVEGGFQASQLTRRPKG